MIEEILKDNGVDIYKPIISYYNIGHLASRLCLLGKALLNNKLIWDYDGSIAQVIRKKSISIVQ